TAGNGCISSKGSRPTARRKAAPPCASTAAAAGSSSCRSTAPRVCRWKRNWSHIVTRGQKRVEDARERAYDPRVHLLRENDGLPGHKRVQARLPTRYARQ